VLDGLRGEDSIAELCRKEGIAQGLYYTWSKEFMEAGKRRLAGDTARAAATGEMQDLCRDQLPLRIRSTWQRFMCSLFYIMGRRDRQTMTARLVRRDEAPKRLPPLAIAPQVF
jgi:transposase-like protein